MTDRTLAGRRRILVVGCSGAGKSTLSRELGAACGLPVVHLDRHYWQPGWVASDDESWRRTLDELLREPAWVMDGSYHITLARRLERADAVVFLDLPRRICMMRILWRLVTWFGRSRADLAPGCPEQWDGEFVRWVWRWKQDVRPWVLAELARPRPEVMQITLRSPRDVAGFLRGVRDRGPGPGGG